MQKICTNCIFIGNQTRKTYLFVLGPILLLLLGVGMFFTNITESFFRTLASVIWISFGVYSLNIFISKPLECPNCNKRRTMIPLDTPRAQELIKENNLTIPSESSEQTKAPTT